MKQKRFIASVCATLAAIMCFSFIACSSEPAGNDETDSNAPASETASSEAETTLAHDDLGEFDFDGYTFRIYSPGPDSMTWLNPVLNVDEMNGEALNDAVFTRNRAIEQRFNFTITETYGNWDIGVADMRKSVDAGDDSFDLMTMMDRFALNSYTAGLIYALDKVPHVDLTKDYWNPDMAKSLTIGKRNIFAYGDFSLSFYDCTCMLLFNKKMIEDFSLESPYDLVKSGKWTYDVYSAMCVEVTDDTDGDGKMTDKDRWGLLSMPKQVLPDFWIAAGELSVDKNENDEPYFSVPADERFHTVIAKIFAITYDTETWYHNTIIADTDTTLENMFGSNQSLFLDSSFRKIARQREMDADFGIIPFPKWDETQKQYYTRVPGGNFAVIPVTAMGEALERTGVVLEALASGSHSEVIPTYYDITLKTKYSRDEESAAMLDIIFSGRVCDLGDSFWCDQIRDDFFKAMFTDNNRDLASIVAKKDKPVSKIIQKAVDACAAID